MASDFAWIYVSFPVSMDIDANLLQCLARPRPGVHAYLPVGAREHYLPLYYHSTAACDKHCLHSHILVSGNLGCPPVVKAICPASALVSPHRVCFIFNQGTHYCGRHDARQLAGATSLGAWS